MSSYVTKKNVGLFWFKAYVAKTTYENMDVWQRYKLLKKLKKELKKLFTCKNIQINNL